MDLTNIKFYKKFEHGHGTMFIVGSSLSLDHLTKLWAKYKKIVQEKYKIGVVANFYSIDKNTTKCWFFLDRAYAEKYHIDERIYEHRFADTFQFWATGFESIIDSISFDIQRAKMITEEKDGDKIAERIFKNYASTIEKHLLDLTNPQTQIQKQRKERKAHEKAAKAKRVAKALAKKAAQQDLSHKD